jgi:hypothetical protein
MKKYDWKKFDQVSLLNDFLTENQQIIPYSTLQNASGEWCVFYYENQKVPSQKLFHFLKVHGGSFDKAGDFQNLVGSYNIVYKGVDCKAMIIKIIDTYEVDIRPLSMAENIGNGAGGMVMKQFPIYE